MSNHIKNYCSAYALKLHDMTQVYQCMVQYIFLHFLNKIFITNLYILPSLDIWCLFRFHEWFKMACNWGTNKFHWPCGHYRVERWIKYTSGWYKKFAFLCTEKNAQYIATHLHKDTQRSSSTMVNSPKKLQSVAMLWYMTWNSKLIYHSAKFYMYLCILNQISISPEGMK